MSNLLEGAVKDLRAALHKDSIHVRPNIAKALVQGALRKVTLAQREQEDLVPDPFDGTCWHCGTEGPPTHCIDELREALRYTRIERWVKLNGQDQIVLTCDADRGNDAASAERILKLLVGDKSALTEE